MNSCELVTFVTAAACGIAKCFPKEDLPIITAVLSQLAATLATIIEQESINSSVVIPPVTAPVDEIIATTSDSSSIQIKREVYKNGLQNEVTHFYLLPL